MQPSAVAYRRSHVKRFWCALILIPLLAACSPKHSPSNASGSPISQATSPSTQGSSLSQDEIDKALSVAKDEISAERASVSSATAIALVGRVLSSNTGQPCTSGRLLKIKLIGSFPHIVTTGHPVRAGEPIPDFTVRAMIITADASSGQPCLISVQTAEAGEVQPLANAMVLDIG